MSMLYTAGRFKYLTDAGTNASGYRLYTFASGTTTFLTTYTDSTLTTPSTYTTDGSGLKYITLNSRGEAQVWLGSSAYTFVVADASGVTKETTNGVRSSDAIASEALDAFKAQLAGNTGDGLVGHLASETGAVATTLGEVADRTLDAVGDFGCDNTGATNTTSRLLSFYNACISSGKRGYIPAGSYLVTAGVLVFDNGFVEKANMHVETAGVDHVTFLRADSTNSPMLSWSNGTATSAIGQYWRGGYHGGITISQNGQTTSPGQHGVSLIGVWGMEFGTLRVEDAGGSALYLYPALYATTNPDPYAVTACRFRSVEANRCKLYAIQNDNYVGLNGCFFDYVRAVECESGGIFGLGAANEFATISMGTINGWAIDDGTHLAATGGAPSRILIGVAELDDVKNGIRLNRTTVLKVTGAIRFVHRYRFSSFNPSGGYWPVTAIKLAGGTSPNVADIDLDVWHRVESGGSKSDVGMFVDGSSNGNVTDARINQRISDNAGFGFVDTDMQDNVSTTATVRICKDGRPTFDSTIRPVVVACADGSTAIPNTGWGTASAKITMPTEVSDLNGIFSSGQATITYARTYRLSLAFVLTVADGTRVRLGFIRNRSGVLTTVASAQFYANGASAQTYSINRLVALEEGDIVYPVADQNTAGSVTLSTIASHSADNVFTLEAL